MNENLRINNKLVRVCSAIAVGLVGLLFLTLSLAAILQTCRIDQTDPKAEIINFDNDFVLVNLALIILTILGALFFLRKKVSLGSVSTKFTVGVMLIVATIISAAWVHMVQSAASSDKMLLLNTARDAANNKYNSFYRSYSYFDNYSYYKFYPFQLGYVFFAELLFRIFGTGSSDVLLQIPNIIAVDCIFIGMVMLSKRLIERRSVTNLTAIFLTVCLQPMLMTTFTDGILIGLAFSVWSVYHTVRFIKENKWQHAAAAVALIAVSVLLNYNNMIMLAAICIALLLHAIDRFRLKDKKRLITCAAALGTALLMVICSAGLQKGVIASYAARSGTELNTEVSQKLYDSLTDIQWGRAEDPFQWTCPVTFAE